MDLVDEAIEGSSQFAEFIPAGDGQAPGEIALARRDVVEIGLHLVQRTQDGVGQQHAGNGDDQQRHRRKANDGQHHAFHARFNLGFNQRDLRLDTVKIDRGAHRHVPLRQIVGVTQLGHQHLAVARQRRAVLQVVSPVLGDLHQVAVDVHAIRIAVFLEALADAFRAAGLEQAHGLRIVAKEVTVLAVADARQQLDRLSPRCVIAGGGSFVKGFDRGHGHGDITLQGRLGIVEQALARLVNFVARLLLQNEQRGHADEQRKEQHREDGEGQDFSLEAHAHDGSLF